jgi:BioD-like phosphotransacetylase family protein
LEKLKKQKEKLQGEHEKCKKEQGLVKEFLKKKLIECFENIEEDNLVHLSTVFIQYCIYPRLMFSAQDAFYAFQFIKTLHMHRVPNFNILHTFA